MVPENRLEQELNGILEKISSQSGPVLETAKRVLYDTIGLPLKQAIRMSADIYLNQLMDLEDSQEGLRAMLEKRKPVWKDK